MSIVPNEKERVVKYVDIVDKYVLENRLDQKSPIIPNVKDVINSTNIPKPTSRGDTPPNIKSIESRGSEMNIKITI